MTRKTYHHGNLREALLDAARDILSGDGDSVFMKQIHFDAEGNKTNEERPHLFCFTGFLGEEWFVRSYWLIGTDVGAGWGGWANASNTPFRRFKVWVNEGGISTPLVVHWPKGQGTRSGSWVRSPAWVPDLMPTVLELAGATYPTRYNGYDITPYSGQSIVPALQNGSLDRRRWMFWEHMNHKAVRQENWKAVLEREPHGPGQWQLFDMSKDRNEMHDLAKKYPDQLTRMVSDWEEWAQNAHVYPKPPKLEVPNAPVPGWPAYREQ